MVCGSSPGDLAPVLSGAAFDVVLVDMLFKGQDDVSGLEALDQISCFSRSTRLVLQICGEENRLLHLGVDFSWFDIVEAIPKDPSLNELVSCVQDVIESRTFFHAELAPCRSDRRVKSAGERLMSSSVRRKIWSVLARGERTRETVARSAHLSPKAVAGYSSEMNDLLRDLGLASRSEGAERQPVLSTLSSYALKHREFFLDRTVERLLSASN